MTTTIYPDPDPPEGGAIVRWAGERVRVVCAPRGLYRYVDLDPREFLDRYSRPAGAAPAAVRAAVALALEAGCAVCCDVYSCCLGGWSWVAVRAPVPPAVALALALIDASALRDAADDGLRVRRGKAPATRWEPNDAPGGLYVPELYDGGRAWCWCIDCD